MGLSMAERKAVTRQMALRYRKASKEQKGLMLNELCALTGWNRDYARRALRSVAARRRKRPARRASRRVVYDESVMTPLRVIWALMDFACGKRLAAVMGEIVEALCRHGELELDADVEDERTEPDEEATVPESPDLVGATAVPAPAKLTPREMRPPPPP